MHDINGNATRDPSGSSTPTSIKKRRASASVHQQPRQSHAPSSHTPTRQDRGGGGGGYPPLKDEDGSSRSLSPPSSRLIETPSTAGTGQGPGGTVQIGHHRSYSSFRGGSEDGIDERDERMTDSRESLRDSRDLEMDLKRPLPLDHRDVDMRSPHDDIDMRVVKKMRLEEGRTAAPIGSIP